jgi:hypothetical protein
MRRAQLRLRQIITVTVVALLVALATVSAVPRQHALGAVARAASQQATIQRPPGGRRWY